jgi:hypothetical protein
MKNFEEELRRRTSRKNCDEERRGRRAKKNSEKEQRTRNSKEKSASCQGDVLSLFFAAVLRRSS